MLVPSRFAGLTPRPARLILGLIVSASLACVIGSFLVTVPERPPAKEGQGAPDLEAFKQVVARVRAGENYYEAYRDVLSGFGYQIGSVFNWRLPTYAWLLSRFPSSESIQWTLGLLALIGMMMAYAGERRELPPVPAAVTPFLLAGVARWIFDGEAYYAQDVWSAVLLLISVAAYGIERRGLAVAAGLAALAFRELALPYCIIAMAIAFWKRRWLEGAAWLIGLVLFGVFLAWHASEVAQYMPAQTKPGSPLDWIRFGGLAFVLSTVKMNAFVFPLPLPGLAIYLCLALIGLIGWNSERGLLLTLTCFAYLAAFAVVGLPYNIYWGLMTAPLLCFGPIRVPRSLSDLLAAAKPKPAAEQSGPVPESSDNPCG